MNTRFQLVSPNTVMDTSVSAVRVSNDLPFIGGLKFTIDDGPVIAIAFFLLFVYVTAGRLQWREISARFDTSNYNEAALKHHLGTGNWKAKLVKASFIALWPGWMALGFVLAGLATALEYVLHRPRSAR